MTVDLRDSKIQGADIINYLLEKSRINNQAPEERNFHIFYHLLEGIDQEEAIQLALVDEIENRYQFGWFEYLKKS